MLLGLTSFPPYIFLSSSETNQIITQEASLLNATNRNNLTNFTGLGFYASYGRINAAFVGGSKVAFWPDDWETVLGGTAAIGHFIEVFVLCDDSRSIWQEGLVTSFNDETGVHTIRLLDSESEAFLHYVPALSLIS